MSSTLILPADLAKIEVLEQRELEHPNQGDLLRALAQAIEEDGPLGAPPGTPLGAVKSQPVAANCLTTYRARRISGTRPLSAIDLIVLHCTQGSTALGAASWFANDASQGSAHLSLDDLVCYRTLNDQDIPWGAKGANYRGLHIEHAGFVTWSNFVWSTTHRRTIERGAFKTALHCKRYGIPVRWVGPDGLKLGVSGITTHWDCTQAFGGDHTDPGPNFPKGLYLTLVRLYYAQLKIRRIA